MYAAHPAYKKCGYSFLIHPFFEIEISYLIFFCKNSNLCKSSLNLQFENEIIQRNDKVTKADTTDSKSNNIFFLKATKSSVDKAIGTSF